MNSNMNNNQIEQEIHSLEDELSQYRFDYVPVNEIHDDSPGWGTIILAFLAGWMFGD